MLSLATNKPSRLNRTFVGLILIMFGSAAGLGLAELSVRIFYPHARDAVVPGHLFSLDDEVGWKLSPLKNSMHKTQYFSAPYSINSLGFRDKPREVAKSDGMHRILLYGDSLIFGWGVKSGERFSDLVENEASGLEIWNLGVPGYGLDQEIVLYESKADPYKADNVMFFVGASTLSRIHTGYIYSKYKPMFTEGPGAQLRLVPVPKGKNAVLSVLYTVISPFYLPYFVQDQIASLQEVMRLRRTGVRSDRPRSLDSVRMVDGLTKNLLRKALNTAKKREAQMTILVANLSQADRSELRGFCDDNGIGYVEISPQISATATTDENSDLIFGKYDKHWNAKGNRLIAAELLQQFDHSIQQSRNFQ